jgi:hypothetical protein
MRSTPGRLGTVGVRKHAAQKADALITSAFDNMLDKTATFLQCLGHMKTTTLPLKHSMRRLSRTLALLLIPLSLACFTVSPEARAACYEDCDTALENTALGTGTLVNNITGQYNTAIGSFALTSNTDGQVNTAVGSHVLRFNTTGSANTAVGDEVLYSNTTGHDNTATGQGAFYFNTTGSYNTGIGAGALNMNSTGNDNVATGYWALLNNTDGHDNTAVGFGALQSNVHGFSNIALGLYAGSGITTGNNNIDIGNVGAPGDSHRIRIGTTRIHTKTFIAGISGATVADGVGVIVGGDGQLGTVVSSARFKEAIEPMDKASEAILALKPVTFRYKHDLDPVGIPQFGLVAEEVEKVNPDLVARDEQGKPYTVRYEAVNTMLLNEFLKEHRNVQELEANAARQQKQIEALTASLQKLSAQLELSESERRTVLNRQ